MEFTLEDNRDEKDFFGGDSEYFNFDKKNSATVKKDAKNNDKLNDLKEDLEEFQMHSKSELNDENKKYKNNLDKTIKEDKIPIKLISKKTLRNDANKENKNIKKNRKNGHKTNTEINYQNTKQKMEFDFELFNCQNSVEDNYFDVYEDQQDQQDSDRFKSFQIFDDVKTNIQKKHPYTTINNINIKEELDMATDSEGNT